MLVKLVYFDKHCFERANHFVGENELVGNHAVGIFGYVVRQLGYTHYVAQHIVKGGYGFFVGVSHVARRQLHQKILYAFVYFLYLGANFLYVPFTRPVLGYKCLECGGKTVHGQPAHTGGFLDRLIHRHRGSVENTLVEKGLRNSRLCFVLFVSDNKNGNFDKHLCQRQKQRRAHYVEKRVEHGYLRRGQAREPSFKGRPHKSRPNQQHCHKQYRAEGVEHEMYKRGSASVCSRAN